MKPVRSVRISPSIHIGASNASSRSTPCILAGPCQIESREHCLFMAESLQKLCEPLNISLIFKSSFDKANRSSLTGARGVGMEEGLRILDDVRSSLGLPVVTDIHLPSQAAAVAEVADLLQVPAFLCRQTDLLIAAGQTNKPVMIKKGQFMHPEDMQHAAEKAAHGGSPGILLCERGSSFGYRDLVADMRSLVIMRQHGWPLVFDATHSVQSLGGTAGQSGGTRAFVLPLMRAAVAVGVDAVFVECHESPETAPSDGACMLPLGEMEHALRALKILWDARSEL